MHEACRRVFARVLGWRGLKTQACYIGRSCRLRQVRAPAIKFLNFCWNLELWLVQYVAMAEPKASPKRALEELNAATVGYRDEFLRMSLV